MVFLATPFGKSQRGLLALTSFAHGGDKISCSHAQLHALHIQRRGLGFSRRRDPEDRAIASANLNCPVAFRFLEHRGKVFPRLRIGISLHGTFTSSTSSFISRARSINPLSRVSIGAL